MQVAWEALLAQAQANRDQAHANRVLADALLLAMSKEHDCGEPPYGDELQAWFHDAREVVAVGTASVLIGGDVGEASGGNSSCGMEAVVGMPRPHVMDATVGPHTSQPRRRGIVCESTPPKTALQGDRCRMAAGNETASNGEEGLPTQCVVPAFPTAHGSLRVHEPEVTFGVLCAGRIGEAGGEAGGCSDKAVEVEPVVFYIGDAVGDGGVAVEVAALEGKADGVDEVLLGNISQVNIEVSI